RGDAAHGEEDQCRNPGGDEDHLLPVDVPQHRRTGRSRNSHVFSPRFFGAPSRRQIPLAGWGRRTASGGGTYKIDGSRGGRIYIPNIGRSFRRPPEKGRPGVG